MRRPLLLLTVLLAAGCSGSDPADPDLPATFDPALGWRIDPAGPLAIAPGDTAQLTLRDPWGRATDAEWSAVGPLTARVSATGMLAPCFGADSTTVQARTRPIPRVQVQTTIRMARVDVGVVTLVSVQDPEGRPVSLEAATGPLRISVSAGPIRCAGIRELHLSLVDGAGAPVRTIDPIEFAPVAEARLTHQFDWNSQTQPSGRYGLRVVARLGAGNEIASNPIPLTLAHP